MLELLKIVLAAGLLLFLPAGFVLGFRCHDWLLVRLHGLQGAAVALRARARAIDAELARLTGRRA